MVGSVSMVIVLFSLIYIFFEDLLTIMFGFTEFELLLLIELKFRRTQIKILIYFTIIGLIFGLTSIDIDVNGGGFCSIRRF